LLNVDGGASPHRQVPALNRLRMAAEARSRCARRLLN
jgi:hypothetical protein